MTEYYIDLQDSDGTGYCTEDFYFDLDEAKLAAKAYLKDHIVLSRVVDSSTGKVVDFFKRNVL